MGSASLASAFCMHGVDSKSVIEKGRKSQLTIKIFEGLNIIRFSIGSASDSNGSASNKHTDLYVIEAKRSLSIKNLDIVAIRSYQFRLHTYIRFKRSHLRHLGKHVAIKLGFLLIVFLHLFFQSFVLQLDIPSFK
jgi:hypothetical protein